MIGISKLYCGTIEPSDVIRYRAISSELPSHLLQFSKDKAPVVVWNITQKCNLKCIHCYASANNKNSNGELTTKEGVHLINDLSKLGTPVILFSGGEPLIRKDLLFLIGHAIDKGIRAVVSTNGTLITSKMAFEFKKIGLSYVGVSLDGSKKINDEFRGVLGSFDMAMEGIEKCLYYGVKVGLRFTINKYNVKEVPFIFDLIENMNIPRVCFYHLVYSGRGSNLMNEDLSFEESRELMNYILNRTKLIHKKGNPIEVLTVDNHSDGPYLYIKILSENLKKASKVYELMKMNGGNGSGLRIGCVSWDGNIYADQFWRHHNFGNVKENLFSDVWNNCKDKLLLRLKNKKKYVKGRCAICKWLNVCGGNFRARAEAVTGNSWDSDPACYLHDNEII